MFQGNRDATEILWFQRSEKQMRSQDSLSYTAFGRARKHCDNRISTVKRFTDIHFSNNFNKRLVHGQAGQLSSEAGLAPVRANRRWRDQPQMMCMAASVA